MSILIIVVNKLPRWVSCYVVIIAEKAVPNDTNNRSVLLANNFVLL